ncbi:glutathione hydrolase 5 proenzyme [Seriola lalandi dorsalis]|uniref:Glutathione hydrolase n=1 Tax=Seriola lalandi dorsalis TaxID=1841481 RepID=A0A3B4XWU3_SERLL|nr:glutathione hydrolase 5 proenzyme [Seriola lalandi dorsalis]XP_056258681.1 glutathione hydrolase 5 proenzyme [Seriola aureovittata]
MAKYKPWLVSCFILVSLICAVAVICLCIGSIADRRCPSGSFRRAAVAADSKICSEIGRSMLQQGGSAVDGAIAALLCTSVVNPQSMGIGGGSIFTIRNKAGNVKVYNFRETVPRSFKANLLKECPTKLSLCTGSQWIGVPGELRGYEAVHKQYGKLPWAKLFEPTIELAREGIPLPAFLGSLLKNSIVKPSVEKSSLCSLQIVCNKNKTVLSTGDILKFPKLAETMEIIAKQGADAFYTGKIGHDLIQDIQAAGGTLTMEDLKSFKVLEQDAWTVPLGNIQMHIAPPPAGGALLAFILKLMKEFSLTPNSLHGDQKIQMYHHYIEAVRFANGQKRSINDPDFNNGKSADHLIDPSFIKHIKGMISSNHTHKNSYYNISPSSDHVGTTHVSVLDEDGLAVSATSTINQLFGGCVYSPKTGIILNNELSDFCERADTVRAGERPPSSMTPVILESKSGRILVIGGSGGSMITTAVALSIINRLWLGMNLKDAIAAPIIFVDSNNRVNYEPRFNKSVSDSLEALGHRPGNWPYFLNVVNAVEKEKGCIVAVSDKRKAGVSSGY